MTAIALVVVAGCGASPNQPVLANAPRPNPAAVAGVAAGAAAALTLADPNAASRGPEKKQGVPLKEVKVKEHVPADVLDRMDNADANGSAAKPSAASVAKPKAEPAGAKTKGEAPKDALDFGAP